MKKITINEYKKLIKNLLKGAKKGIYTPVMIWGPVGIGKSQVVNDTIKEEGGSVFDIRLSMVDPTDLKGFPVLENKNVEFKQYKNMLPQNDGFGVIFLDELPHAPELVQGAAHQLIHDRRSGNYKVPNGYIIIAAGNREEDGGIYIDMPKSLKTRFAHFVLQPTPEEFIAYINKKYNNLDIISYLAWKKDNIYENNNDEEKFIFSTYRGWENAIKMINIGINHYTAISANVGEKFAIEFETYKEMLNNLKTPKEILDKNIHNKDIKKEFINLTILMNNIKTIDIVKFSNWMLNIKNSEVLVVAFHMVKEYENVFMNMLTYFSENNINIVEKLKKYNENLATILFN